MRTYVNSVFPATTLNGAINNSQTTITVFSEANLPSSGQYVISIDSEYLLVTAGYGTLTLTVTRGLEGTSGASHLSGASVYHPLSTGTLDAIRQDIHQVGVYASLPSTATSKKGDTYRCTDSPYSFWFDGSTWQAQFSEWQVAVPPSAGWSWDNQGSSTIDTSKGQLYGNFQTRTGVNTLRMYYRSAPATPYKVTACFRCDVSGAGDAGSTGQNVYFGPAFRDSSGKIVVLGAGLSGATDYLTVDQWTNSTTFTSQPFQYVAAGARAIAFANVHWVRIQDTGANLIYEWSLDGYNWNTFLSHSRTTFFASGPSFYGICAYVNGDAVRAQVLNISES